MKQYGYWLLCGCLLALSGGCVGFTSKEPCYLPEQVVEVKGLEGKWTSLDMDKECTVFSRQNSYILSGGDNDQTQITFFRLNNTVFADALEGDSHIAFPAMILGNAFWAPFPIADSEYAKAKEAEIKEKVQLLPHQDKEYSTPIVTASTEEIQEHLLVGMIDDLGPYFPMLISKSELPVTSSGLLSREVRTRNYFQLLAGLIRWYDIQEENTNLTEKEQILPLYLILSFMTGFDQDEGYALFGEKPFENEKSSHESFELCGDATTGVHEDVVLAAKLYREAFVTLYSGESSTEVRQKFIAARRAYLQAQKIVKGLKFED